MRLSDHKKTLILIGLSLFSVSTLHAKAVSRATQFTGVLVERAICQIDSRTTPIWVEFGDELITTRVDGRNYMKNIDYKIICGSGNSAGLRFQIKGDELSLSGQKVLDVKGKNGLGIVLYRDSVQMNPNQWYSVNYPHQPLLSAAPIKGSNVNLIPGRFSLLTTLIVDYQ